MLITFWLFTCIKFIIQFRLLKRRTERFECIAEAHVTRLMAIIIILEEAWDWNIFESWSKNWSSFLWSLVKSCDLGTVKYIGRSFSWGLTSKCIFLIEIEAWDRLLLALRLTEEKGTYLSCVWHYLHWREVELRNLVKCWLFLLDGLWLWLDIRHTDLSSNFQHL